MRSAPVPLPTPARRLDPGWVGSRFDRIADIYRVFEVLYMVPSRIRPLSVDRLALLPGERAISVGCGQGRSLPMMAKAVGPTGHVTGIDLSARMLAHAYDRILEESLHNVSIIKGDIRSYRASVPLDAALFSFSLTTLGDPEAVLEHVWAQLRPGGRLVVADAQLPPRLAPVLKPVLPLIRRFQEATVLGDPDMRPLQLLQQLGPPVQVEELRGRSYFIASVTKPLDV